MPPCWSRNNHSLLHRRTTFGEGALQSMSRGRVAVLCAAAWREKQERWPGDESRDLREPWAQRTSKISKYLYLSIYLYLPLFFYMSVYLYIYIHIFCSIHAYDSYMLARCKGPFTFEFKMPTDVSRIRTDTTLDHSLHMASRTPPFFREEIKKNVGLRHLNSSDLFRLLSWGLEAPISGTHLLRAPSPTSILMLEIIPWVSMWTTRCTLNSGRMITTAARLWCHRLRDTPSSVSSSAIARSWCQIHWCCPGHSWCASARSRCHRLWCWTSICTHHSAGACAWCHTQWCEITKHCSAKARSWRHSFRCALFTSARARLWLSRQWRCRPMQIPRSFTMRLPCLLNPRIILLITLLTFLTVPLLLSSPWQLITRMNSGSSTGLFALVTLPVLNSSSTHLVVTVALYGMTLPHHHAQLIHIRQCRIAARWPVGPSTSFLLFIATILQRPLSWWIVWPCSWLAKWSLELLCCHKPEIAQFFGKTIKLHWWHLAPNWWHLALIISHPPCLVLLIPAKTTCCEEGRNSNIPTCTHVAPCYQWWTSHHPVQYSSQRAWSDPVSPWQWC